MIHRARFIINSPSSRITLHPIRQDGSPGCDTSEHPGTGTRARGRQCWRPAGNACARRTSPTAHREERSRSASGTKAGASSPRGGETPLDRPRARLRPPKEKVKPGLARGEMSVFYRPERTSASGNQRRRLILPPSLVGLWVAHFVARFGAWRSGRTREDSALLGSGVEG